MAAQQTRANKKPGNKEGHREHQAKTQRASHNASGTIHNTAWYGRFVPSEIRLILHLAAKYQSSAEHGNLQLLDTIRCSLFSQHPARSEMGGSLLKTHRFIVVPVYEERIFNSH